MEALIEQRRRYSWEWGGVMGVIKGEEAGLGGAFGPVSQLTGSEIKL